jgi:hypothetical protein
MSIASWSRALRVSRPTQFALFTGFVLLTSAGVPACKNDREPSTAHISPGKMPEGGNWNGVYFNPVFGNLHLVQTGNSIAGRWKRTDGSAWGEMNGPVQGNLYRFDWTEHKVGLVGPSSTSKGKGYFLYMRPPGDNIDDELKGEWGLNTDETGNAWDGVKQRHVEPDLKSIGGVAEPGGPSKDWK